MKKLLLIFLAAVFSYAAKGQILRQPIPDRTVVLTFDDATASQYSVVVPLLAKYGFQATFFICEFPPHFADTTLYLNWRQIKN